MPTVQEAAGAAGARGGQVGEHSVGSSRQYPLDFTEVHGVRRKARATSRNCPTAGSPTSMRSVHFLWALSLTAWHWALAGGGVSPFGLMMQVLRLALLGLRCVQDLRCHPSPLTFL